MDVAVLVETVETKGSRHRHHHSRDHVNLPESHLPFQFPAQVVKSCRRHGWVLC